MKKKLEKVTLIYSLMTEGEVAEMLRVSVALMRKWRLNKTGPPFKKLGRLVRYDRSAVVAWKDSQ